MVKTVYWDDKDKRFMVIVKNGCHVRHHKVPKEIVDLGQAEAYADPLTDAYTFPEAPKHDLAPCLA